MSVYIGQNILKYKDEILEDIVRLVRIQSFRGPELPGMPYGKGPADALKFCLDLAANFGLQVKNAENYAGHIEFGEGDDLVGILAHVDVVPAGEGWTVPPFNGEVRDGRIYGRGTIDDKGPAVAAIYCLKTLHDMNIKTKRKIRVILGAGEECGMEDMAVYFQKEKKPDFAFTPDGEYPICNVEKGILHLKFKSNVKKGSKILRLESGDAANMVPMSAQAVVLCTQEEMQMIESEASDAEKSGIRFAVTKQDDSLLQIHCMGKSAHASTPEQGKNAAAYLIKLLSNIQLEGLPAFLHHAIGLSTDGRGLGIDCGDADSGALTLNLGTVFLDGEKCEAVIDIRYPVSKDGNQLFQTIKRKAADNGIETILINDEKQLYVASDSYLIRTLRKAYKTVMNKDAGLYSTGGGSYARTLDNKGAAFGAGFKPLSYYNIHAADEFLEIDDFMKHCEICLQAIYELACG